MNGVSSVRKAIAVVVTIVAVPLVLFSQDSNKKPIIPPLVKSYIVDNDLRGFKVLDLYKNHSKFKEDEVNLMFKQDYSSMINTIANILSSKESYDYSKVNDQNLDNFMADALSIFWSNFHAIGSNKNLMASIKDNEADCDISALFMSDILYQFNPNLKVEFQFVREDYQTSGHIMLKVNDKYYDTTTGHYGLESLTVLNREQLENKYKIIYNPIKSYVTLTLNQNNEYDKAEDIQTESYTLHNQANNLIGNVIYMDDKYLIEGRLKGREIPYENLELALQKINKAIKLNSNNPDLYLTRAIIKNELNYDVDYIVYDVDQALELTPCSMLLMKYKAHIYEENNNIEDSKRVRNQIKSIEDANSLMSFNIDSTNTSAFKSYYGSENMFQFAPKSQKKLEILKKQARKAQKPPNKYSTKPKNRAI